MVSFEWFWLTWIPHWRPKYPLLYLFWHSKNQFLQWLEFIIDFNSNEKISFSCWQKLIPSIGPTKCIYFNSFVLSKQKYSKVAFKIPFQTSDSKINSPFCLYHPNSFPTHSNAKACFTRHVFSKQQFSPFAMNINRH